jgi:cation:H+ antiporter
VLAKGADWLVDGAVGVASKLRVPTLIIGIVLVGFGTTMPEFTVSLISAVQRHSEIALGNAVGSVIVNVSIALALGVIVAPTVLRVERSMFLSIGLVFFGASVLAFVLALDGRIGRVEGLVLLAALAAYVFYLVVSERKRKARKFEQEVVEEVESHVLEGGLAKFVFVFLGGLVVVVVASKFLVEAAVNIAGRLGISKTIIGLTIVAIGTSLPEIATSVVASRKGHGELAFGDVMGANVLNLLWIIGGASVARPIIVTRAEIYFMFPFMVGIVAAMFLLARIGYTLNRWKSLVLVGLYLIYTAATILVFVSG